MVGWAKQIEMGREKECWHLEAPEVMEPLPGDCPQAQLRPSDLLTGLDKGLEEDADRRIHRHLDAWMRLGERVGWNVRRSRLHVRTGWECLGKRVASLW